MGNRHIRTRSTAHPSAAPPPTPRARAAAWYAGPILVALVASAATLATLAPSAGGPGITCDELYHVATGKRLVQALRQQGAAFFSPAAIATNFPWTPDGPPVHPPLGNWILGWTHHWFDQAPDDAGAVSIVAARFAPALVFGLLVLIVGLWTARREGPLAGTVAASATALVPRMFAHGHFAALDMITTFFFVAALLAILEAELHGRRWWHFTLAGAVWGLAMLTRLHGVLLVVPVVAWLVIRRVRRRPAHGEDGESIRRRLTGVVCWAGMGLVTLFVGWPWLWLAPMAHLKQFVSTGVDRQAIHVFYAGQVWADHAVPWHYPLAMFLVTLPLGFLALGIVGLWAKGRKAEQAQGYGLLVGSLAWVLLVFAGPTTPVYDGVRLFLMVFPLWAILVGVGGQWLVEHPVCKRLPPRLRGAAVGLLVVGQAMGIVVYHPCQLSHYSLLVGGLRGAERLGFEVTYWGDSVTEPLLAEAARLAPGESVVFGPSLAPFQAPGVAISSPALADHDLRLVDWGENSAKPPRECRLGIFYHRKADLAQIPPECLNAEPLKDCQRQGVWLAKLVRLPPRAPGPSAAERAEK